MSRGNIRRQIAAKERQIREIDNQLVRKFGIYDTGRGRALTALDRKKEKLQAEIEDLHLEL
jgi:archaellum component FlaC